MKYDMETERLKFLADIQTGPFGSQLHKEDYVKYGTPIVTVEHLGKRIFTEQNLPKVSEEDKNRLNKYLLKRGDIVFSRVGSVDRCSFVDEEHEGWLFSGRCLRVRPLKKINPLFLYYFFCLENTKEFMRSIAVGATMPSINTRLIGEIKIKFPDYKKQEKIVNVLSAIDDKIELNKDEYKFYLDPEDWQSVGTTIKISIFKNAMGYVLIKNNKSSINVEDYVESIDLLNKIKLYSTFNNEELGAFSLKPEEVKNAYQRSVKEKSYTEFKKLWNSGYKFNEHPTIPNEN